MFTKFTTRLALTVFALALFIRFTSAQCVIDTNNYELISPSADKLPCIERNVPYEATIQLFAIPSIGVSIDSFLITTFLDLPTGINYTLNPSPCKLYPYDRGCVHITGITTDTAGVYVLDYNGIVYLQQGSPTFDYLRANFPSSLPEYSLRVIEQSATCPNTTTGTEDLKGNALIEFSVYPNPSSGRFEITCNENYAAMDLNVYNANGAVVFTEKINIPAGNKTALDLGSYPKGLYLVQLSTPQGSSAKHISVE